jgi:hypothetical protein
MQIAPHSCREAWNGTPVSRSALVTARLPLPIRPNAMSTPSAPSARPTSSATVLPATVLSMAGQFRARAAQDWATADDH